MTADGLIALDRANRGFEQRLRVVGPEDWSRPTPCEEWDVRALVNHVVGGNRRYRMLLQGASAEDVNRTRTEDHVGEDAVQSFASTAADLLIEFRQDGVPDRVVHHPIGDRTAAELLAMRVLDVTVHTWDLARALAADDTLDLLTVEYSLDQLDVITSGREHGSFTAPSAATDPDASAQTRLLHLAGRSLQEDRK